MKSMLIKKRIIINLLFLFGLKFGIAQCFLKAVPSWGTPLSTTGSEKLDQILVYEKSMMELDFGLKVNLYAYEDGSNPNAYAAQEFYSILMGKTLMLDEFVKTNNTLSIIAIMAHEYGHILQYHYKLNSNGTWVGKWPELHADFLAGWYMGKKQYLSKTDTYKLINGFWENGDDNYYSPQHHGTQEERSLAFYQGFLNSNLNLDDAYVYGANFIANINRELEK